MKKITGYSAALAMLAAATLAGCPTADFQSQVLTDSNQLDGKQLYFIPRNDDTKRVGDAFYERIVRTQLENAQGTLVDITTLPNNPADDTPIVFPATGPAVQPLGEPVLYFGEFYTHLFIGKNGAIVLGKNATVPAGSGNENANQHFTNPQISLLPLAADAIDANATVTFGQTDDFVVVSYQNVKIGTADDNSFQVEFFKTRGIDGDIALSYPIVSGTGTTGLMGLSNGQLSEDANFLSQFGTSGADLTQNYNTNPAAAS